MSRRKPARLATITAEPLGEQIIERLEEALERARAGELSSCALAVVYRDGTTGQSWSNAPSIITLLGSAARLQFKLNRLIDDA